MTATDELRRLLDERGVEWRAGEIMTFTDGADYMPTAWDTLHVELYDRTPEQAVEATLGRGTCYITVEDNLAETEGTGDVWLECSACHWQMLLEPTPPRFGYCPPLFRYCPNCGRAVVA